MRRDDATVPAADGEPTLGLHRRLQVLERFLISEPIVLLDEMKERVEAIGRPKAIDAAAGSVEEEIGHAPIPIAGSKEKASIDGNDTVQTRPPQIPAATPAARQRQPPNGS
jgi:hypothetical protein